MPTVPRYDGPQVSPTVQQTGGFSSAPVGGDPGRQAQDMGAALQQVGRATAGVAEDVARQANQLRVDDALNQAKEQALRLTYDKDVGYSNLRGWDALNRPDGKPLADEYGDTLKEQINKIGEGLGNDAQKQAFSLAASSMLSGFRGQAMAHEAQEFKTYHLSVATSTMAQRQNDISQNWRDPNAIDEAINGKTIEVNGTPVMTVTGLKKAAYDAAILQGHSAQEAEGLSRKMSSNGLKVGMLAALDAGNADVAQGLLAKYSKSGDMDADDILAVQGHITREMEQRQAATAATRAVLQLAPQLNPSDFDRMVNITLQSESNGQRYGPDGKALLTSRAGAKGEMQVLDSTNANPGFGVKPAKDNSPEERARVGRDYLQAMLQRYGGDPAKAWAAYNAGPKTVDEAVMRANASPTPGASWLTFTPNETQAYVAKNTKLLTAGLGRPQAPTVADLQASVRQQLGPDAKPSVVEHAVTEASRQWEVQTKALQQRDDQVVADAQRMLLSNGGDFNALPSSLRTNLPPGKVDDLMGFAGKIARGEHIATDWGLYYQLSNNPDLLKQTNLMALRSKLADGEFKQLTDRQEKLNNPNSDSHTQLQSARDVLNTFMRQAGIDPTPKDDDKDGGAKVAKLLSAFQARIDARESATGKKLDTAQLQVEAAELFKPVQVSVAGWFTHTVTDTPITLVGPGDRVIVPNADRSRIVQALKQAGRPVDNEAIEALYRAHNHIPQRTVSK